MTWAGRETRANPWSPGILCPLFSWGVKSIAFNPSLVHKRSPQSNPDIRHAPASASQQRILSGSMGVGGQQSTREADKCVCSFTYLKLEPCNESTLVDLFAAFLQMQSLSLFGNNGEGGRLRAEWPCWWGLDGPGRYLMCSRMRLPGWLQLMFNGMPW